MPVPSLPISLLLPSREDPSNTTPSGLKGLLENNGSVLAYNATPLTPTNGNTPSINPLSTRQSKLHAFGEGNGQPGYSIDGSQYSEVSPQYNSYVDGDTNILPDPTSLDLNDPIGIPGYSIKYDSSSTYVNASKPLTAQPYIP
jgi:hypothetical protein